MWNTSLAVLLVVLQSSPDAAVSPQDVRTRVERATIEDEVPVLYFPKATNGLKRRKRVWLVAAINIPENDRGPFPKKIAPLRSTKGQEQKVFYSITGPGADQPPKDLFTMDRDTGYLYVTQRLDREATANFTLQAYTMAEDSSLVEIPMEINVFVVDMNDNSPKFTQDTYMGEVAEASPIGFEFIKVTATDADEEGTQNANIHYSIINQEPKSPTGEMFSINPVTGFIRVNAGGLDRDKNPKYTLEVEAADMAGKGLKGKTKVILTVTDGNNKAPVFGQSQYNTTVAENEKDAFVVKMSVMDGDHPQTPAWNSKFTIIDGDTGGLFSVETGPDKQEGIITTAKGLDFEKADSHTLLVIVENEVPFAIPLQTATATVHVTVQDMNDPPVFQPEIKLVTVSENMAVNASVVGYTAYDPDKLRKQKVMYKLVSDPAGWLNVANETGLITVKNEMDRESPFVAEDIYTALIGAYDNDEVPATGTGTIQIKLKDVNDNAPTIEEQEIKVCNKEPAPHLLTVTDKDGPGFTSPFTVTLEATSKTSWTAQMNDSESLIILTLVTELPSGMYTVVLQVADNKGLHQDSTVQVEVCDCTGPNVKCGLRFTGERFLAIIPGVLAGIMLLMLLLLFARRKRVDEKEPLLQDDPRDNLCKYNEQGGGENDQDYDLGVLHQGLDNRPAVYREQVPPNFMPAPVNTPRPTNPDEIGNFIADNIKVADNDPTAPPYDTLLLFNYKGVGSDFGSLSSLNSSSSGDQDHSCLDDWGPRFKKLADMFGRGEDDDM